MKVDEAEKKAHEICEANIEIKSVERGDYAIVDPDALEADIASALKEISTAVVSLSEEQIKNLFMPYRRNISPVGKTAFVSYYLNPKQIDEFCDKLLSQLFTNLLNSRLP